MGARQTWGLDRVHGLPAVPAFFPSASKNNECWWETCAPNTVYAWDSMEDQDRHNSMRALCDTEHWVVWKTKDKNWTHTLKWYRFHQLLFLDQDTKANSCDHKIKGW